MIGIDPMSGYNRFSGGVHELSDGLGVLPLAVGLFGVSEIMLAYGTRAMQPMKPRFSELLPSRAEARASVGPIGRGTVIGFLIGIIPGSAHILSSFVSYAVEKKLSDHPERFGKGAVEGVAGPESANNAAACGAFVPMLALGVPLGPVQAILIAVLVVHGIAPGPLLITQQPQLFWGFIASMYIGNLVLLILNLPLVGLFVSLLRIPYTYLYPVILICCIVGVYTVNHSMVEVLIMAAGGRRRLRPAQAALRRGADRARLHPGADAGDGVPPIAGDVGRGVYNLPAAADHGRIAGDRRRCCLTIGADPGGLAPAGTPERSQRNGKANAEGRYSCALVVVGTFDPAIAFAATSAQAQDKFPSKPDHHPARLSAGRLDRHHRAGDRAGARAHPRPAGGDPEPARRRGADRHHAGRQCGARRLHGHGRDHAAVAAPRCRPGVRTAA